MKYISDGGLQVNNDGYICYTHLFVESAILIVLYLVSLKYFFMTFNDYSKTLIYDIPLNVYIVTFVTLCLGTAVMIGIFGFKRGGKYGVLLLLFEYLILIYSSTVFFRSVSKVREFNFIPFWSYSVPELFWENVMNFVSFVPIGILLGVVSHKTTRNGVVNAVMIGFCLSLGIEVLQFLLKKGFSEVDDVIHNTLGCVTGYIIYLIIVKVWNWAVKYR